MDIATTATTTAAKKNIQLNDTVGEQKQKSDLSKCKLMFTCQEIFSSSSLLKKKKTEEAKT